MTATVGRYRPTHYLRTFSADLCKLKSHRSVRHDWVRVLYYTSGQLHPAIRYATCSIVDRCTITYRDKFNVVVVWPSGSALALINKVNLSRARLVLGWVTVSGFDFRGDILFRYVASHPGRLSLLPLSLIHI